ncbi:MAG: hypothetical protein MJZ33_14760 [Paludibacteraceae bacterium]|nr:hypothetical protein [Paludibacteraceae bacterium]
MKKVTQRKLSVISFIVFFVLLFFYSDIGHLIFYLFGCVVSLVIFFVLSMKYYYFNPKIDGYEIDDNSYKIANSNCDEIIAVLSYSSPAISKTIHKEMQNTIATYSSPSDNLLSELVRLSRSNIIDSKMYISVLSGLSFRKENKITDISDSSDINLKNGEVLYFMTNMSSLQRYETYSVNYSSISYRSSLGGVVGRIGNVVTHKNEKMSVVSALGTTYVTNKRVVYIDHSTQKTYTIQLGRVLKIYIESNAVNVVVQDGKPYKFHMPLNFMYDVKTDIFYDNVYKMSLVLATLLKGQIGNASEEEL